MHKISAGFGILNQIAFQFGASVGLEEHEWTVSENVSSQGTLEVNFERTCSSSPANGILVEGFIGDLGRGKVLGRHASETCVQAYSEASKKQNHSLRVWLCKSRWATLIYFSQISGGDSAMWLLLHM